MPLPQGVIFDLDGTLALLGERSPYNASRAEDDELSQAVFFAYQAIRRGKPETAIILLSGREDRWRPQTERWLTKHDITFDALYLRRTGDRRKDTVVKREIYEARIAGVYDIVVVFEDRDQVVKLWRDDLGLPCFQVAWGDF